jgi:hypothetical protein
MVRATQSYHKLDLVVALLLALALASLNIVIVIWWLPLQNS